MRKKQPFNPIPLIAIAITSGGFALVSILSINWKGAVIESTNNPELPSPIQIDLPATTAANEDDQPSVDKAQEEIEPKYEATVFVPKYEPILPSGVQKNSPAWFCWQSGGGRDCLLRDWNYSPPPQPLSEWEEYELSQQRKTKPKKHRNSVEKLLRWIP
ncbi:MAG: hypothetical protein AAFO04_19345 [Cyanobacteria bacterium J06592_8]